MAIVDFEQPDSIKNTTYKKILKALLNEIPDKYDKLEGGFVHDMIAPTALEAAELIQLWLPLAIRTNFHMWADGQWLDYHAMQCGLTRLPATSSYGDVKVTTTGKVKFPAGFVFSIPSENNEPAIDFETTQAYSFTDAGTYTVRVKSVLTGSSQNIAAGSISIMKNPVKNVASIDNEATFTGGTDAEDDESLRERIDDFYAGRGASFVGNKRDYERWAREIAGVGYAHCIPLYFKAWQAVFKVTNASGNEIKGNLQVVAGDTPNELKIISDANTTLSCDLEYSGYNSVKLVIADADGNPALPERIAEVEQHIFGTGHDDINRLAPIGVVKYEVSAPTSHEIKISMQAQLTVAASTVKTRMVNALRKHFKTLADEDNNFGTLKYSKVAAIISNVNGISDFKNMKLNNGTDNVSFERDEIPTIETSYITITTY